MKKFLALLICTSILCGVLVTAMAEEIKISFKEPDYILNINKKLNLDIKAEGISKKDLNLEYSSSDEAVVSISKNKAEAVGEGKATITCTATDKEKNIYTAKCIITVIIPIKKVYVEEKSITLALDDSHNSGFEKDDKKESEYAYLKDYYSYRPKIIFEPENASIKDIEWQSSKPSVAYVSEDGVISSNWNYGKTIITGTTKDGSKKTVKINVTVPRTFTTTNEIVIDSPAGVKFGSTQSDGISSRLSITNYGISKTVGEMRVKGDCFDIKFIDAQHGFYIFHVLPVKEGKGSIEFIINNRTIQKISVKVLKSAVENNAN